MILDTFGGPTQKIQVNKIQRRNFVETARTEGGIRPSGLSEFGQLTQPIKPYPLGSKSYPNTRLHYLLASENHLNPKFFYFPLSFSFSLFSLFSLHLLPIFIVFFIF